jgi:hypothetical protein
MPPAVDGYRARAAEYRETERGVARSVNRVGTLRLAVFGAAVLLFAAAVSHRDERVLFGTACALAMAAFFALIRRSARLQRERRRARDLAELNEQAAYRCERDWTHVTPRPWTTGTPTDGELDDVALDLDLYGPRGLAALLPPVTRALGQPRIRDWFRGAAAATTIVRRQAAVRELTEAWTFRDNLAVCALHGRASAEQIERFRAWAVEAPAQRSPWLAAASVIVPALTLSFIALQLAGILATPLWAYTAAVAVAIASATRRTTRARLEPVAEMSTLALTFAEMLSLVQRQSWTSPQLTELRAALQRGDEEHSSAAASVTKLSDIGGWAETIASPMLHGALQALVLWDLHVARRLDAWRIAHGRQVGEWLDALGDIEALAAFAALAHANPDWHFPEFAEGESSGLRARGLGHPLLSPAVRVVNDVAIGPPHTVQLISGSNMSGKSTLLRAAGLNVILAQAGAPVCAESMSLPLVRLRTSIQVHDSLHEGISYFMAELRRLKSIIDAAAVGGANERPALYLIDEILRGTNSEERAVAARTILERLLATNAIGIITSHDLAMFAAPALTPYIDHHHFRETIDAAPDGDRMRFDYRLHDGPATSSNALRLLALVGIA